MTNMPKVVISLQSCTVTTWPFITALQKPFPPTPLADMLALVECHWHMVGELNIFAWQACWVLCKPSVQDGIIISHH